jgi:transglutaminase-like putative cysteine protease
MATYRVKHVTEYSYEEPASICHNELHLVPRTSLRQTCHNYRLRVTPEPAVMARRTDYFGNDAIYFTLQEMHRTLRIEMLSEVAVEVPAPPEVGGSWNGLAAPETLSHNIEEFALESPFIEPSRELAHYAQQSFGPDRDVVEGALDLMHRIHADFTYEPGASQVSTPLTDVFATRRGVCQDFAHLAIGCLRSLGLPARYVSGYLLTQPPPGQPRLLGADASHAWFSIYCGASGWLDLDPTNDIVAGDQHVTLAWGRDYGDVAPVRGVVQGGGRHHMRVGVDVVPA